MVIVYANLLLIKGLNLILNILSSFYDKYYGDYILKFYLKDIEVSFRVNGNFLPDKFVRINYFCSYYFVANLLNSKILLLI